MLILTQAEVARLLPMERVLEAVRQGAAAYSAGRCVMPPRTRVLIDEGNGALFMPGYVREPAIFGQKVDSGFGRNAAAGLPRSHGAVLLLEVETGRAQALLDATYLTDARTGALTGVAAELLARPESRLMGLIGAGQQARTQIDAVLAVLPIEEVRIWSRTPERVERMVESASAKHPGVRIRAAASGEEAAAGADVVVCATTARDPVVRDAWLEPGMFLSSVGATMPDHAEFEPATVARADKVVVDARVEVLQRAGDVAIPLQRGLLQEERIAELGELVLGTRPGRERPDELTYFKSAGFAAVDLTTAHLVYELARQEGVGTELDLHAG
jgi:ornithine cyclodeaminase